MSVAIVTGASRGLGEALATGLARAGWSLVVDGRDPVTLDAAADRIRAGADGRRHGSLSSSATSPTTTTATI